MSEIKRYLMSQPKKEYIESQSLRLDRMITSAMNRFVAPEGIAGTEVTKMRKEHEKEYDVPKYRRQLKTMRFILS